MPSPEELRLRHRNERIAAAVLILLLLAATAALIVYDRSAEVEITKQQTYVPRQTPVTPEVELLQKYIRIDTSNPPGNELPAAQWLAGIIRAAGVEAEILESRPGRASVYARIRGREPGHGLMLLHHIDVVPAAGEGWTRPPFSGQIHLDQLYGRGALDMKGTGIVFLRAFLDVAANPLPPKHDLVFLAVADEETGGEWGLRWLLANRPKIFEGVRYALNEGGITEMRQERVTYYGIEIGTKLTVTLTLVGPTREQLQQTRIALEPKFSPLREPGRVLPEVKRFFRDVAPLRLEFRDELSDIDRAIARGQFWRLPVGYRELTQNIMFADAVRSGDDGRHSMRVVLHNLPDENPDPLIAEVAGIARRFGVSVGEVSEKIGPVPISPIDTPLWNLLEDEAARTFRAPVGTEILNRSTNDSRFLRERGIVAYGISPFAVDFFQSDAIHKADERVRVDYFVEGVAFLRRVISRWAGVTENVTQPQK